MPTFCRHNRFIERCPICSKTLPGMQPAAKPARAGTQRAERSGERARSPRREAVRVRHETRAADDGYRSPLAPGLRSSADALRLAEEIAFSAGRLAALAGAPPDLYGEIATLRSHDIERACWACFLTAYLCPLQGDDPFAGIRMALHAGGPESVDLAGVPLGPRSCHDAAGGAGALEAYSRWTANAGSQHAALLGDPGWSAQRRFGRLAERLVLPGFSRACRYELLVLLGRLGLFELQADSLQLVGARSSAAEDATVLAAKRVFGIGDPLLLERRAAALAEAAAVPLEALDLALWNWSAPERVTLGFTDAVADAAALERAGDALAL